MTSLTTTFRATLQAGAVLMLLVVPAYGCEASNAREVSRGTIVHDALDCPRTVIRHQFRSKVVLECPARSSIGAGKPGG